MWGYAWLGVATWLVAPVFDGAGVERAARATFGAVIAMALLALATFRRRMRSTAV